MIDPVSAAVALALGGDSRDDHAAIEAARARNADQLDAPGALARAAAWYASNGVPVFPLRPQGKAPITASGVLDATTDLAVVHDWWTRRPDANIGAACGFAFDVLDLDGPEAYRSLGDELDIYLNVAIGIALTPREHGMHIYLPPNPGRRNGAGLLPGVDARARGGYVVVPPSRTERRYVWLRALNTAKESES